MESLSVFLSQQLSIELILGMNKSLSKVFVVIRHKLKEIGAIVV